MEVKVGELMTPYPETLPTSATARKAAQVMRDKDIGNVILVDDEDRICGIVTDRDLVVRLFADPDLDPDNTTLSEICSRELTTIDESRTTQDAAELMRKHSVRRLPVVSNGKPV